MFSNKNEKIIIVGFGWVGQANAIALSKAGYNVSFFDIQDPVFRYVDKYGDDYGVISRISNLEDVDSEDTWYIVCVGDRVLEDGTQDISAIEKALKSLENLEGGVILRSTILPDKLKDLNFNFYVPEFLHEKKAIEESILPQYYVVGIKDDSKGEPSFLKLWESTSTKTFKGTPEEASHIKYLSNLWNSMRIAFVNEIGNTISVPKDKESLNRIENIIDFFFERKAYLRYGKSYGGHCLPKDTHAYSAFYSNNGKDVPLIKSVHLSNLNHRNLEEEYDGIPEWFSEWERPQISGRVALRALFSSIKRNIQKVFK